MKAVSVNGVSKETAVNGLMEILTVFGIFDRHGHDYTEIVPDCLKAKLQGINYVSSDLKNIFIPDVWRDF